jgi:hypothetical protein
MDLMGGIKISCQQDVKKFSRMLSFQSIPRFFMGIFKIHKQLCKEINDEMASFRWGDTD